MIGSELLGPSPHGHRRYSMHVNMGLASTFLVEDVVVGENFSFAAGAERQ